MFPEDPTIRLFWAAAFLGVLFVVVALLLYFRSLRREKERRIEEAVRERREAEERLRRVVPQRIRAQSTRHGHVRPISLDDVDTNIDVDMPAADQRSMDR